MEVSSKESAEEECPRKTIGVLPLQETSMALDLKESAIESILTFLEERSKASDQDQPLEDAPAAGGPRVQRKNATHTYYLNS